MGSIQGRGTVIIVDDLADRTGEEVEMGAAIPDERRTRTVLAWMGLSVENYARQAGISTRYLWHILKGEKVPSQALLRRLQQTMGDAAWSFATGASDSLPANNEPPKKEEA